MKDSPIAARSFISILHIIRLFILDNSWWNELMINPISIFTPEFFYINLIYLLFPLVIFYCVIDYGLWYIAYKRALTKGIAYERRDYKVKRYIEKILIYMIISVFMVIFIGGCVWGYWKEMFEVLAAILVVLASFIGTKALLKKFKVRSEFIMLIASAVFLITSFLLIGMLG